MPCLRRNQPPFYPTKTMNYQPTPIDTSTITLPHDLHELTERLAENSHDVWAVQRMKDGWTYGLERSDAEKKHPCLVPYAELPESEKEYDRLAAVQTLKAIIVLGYRIERK